MLAASNDNPLNELYTVLHENIKHDSNYETKSIDNEPILKLMLANNGCGFTENCVYRQSFLENTANYGIYYLFGAQANEANGFFDYIEFFGMKYLIIFMDYFKDFYTQPELTDDEVENTLNRLMGKSIYFDALKKIVDVYISTTVPAAELMGSLSSTSASLNYRYAGVFIAAKILDDEVGLTEDDVSCISYDDIRTALDTLGIPLLTLGIRYRTE